MTLVPRNILFINVSRIGDTLLATPAIRAVARAFPAAKIDVLAHPRRYEVLEHLPYIHRLGGIDKRTAAFWGRFGGRPYDLAFVYNFDKALVRYALRVARHVVAFRQDDDALNRRIHTIVEPIPSRTEHIVTTLLRLPAAYGVPPAGVHLDYEISSAESEWAQDFLRERAIDNAHPLFGLQIASFPTKAFRDWPVENFLAVCQKVRTHYPTAHFVIFGGELEKDRTQLLAEQLGAAATLCAGRLSLRQTGALMGRVDLYIGVDTGPTHLMGALHRPMIAMYHGHLPSYIAEPLDHPSLAIIDHPDAGRNCPVDAPMAAITVERVFEAALRLLHMHYKMPDVRWNPL